MLKVEHVETYYGKVKALKNVSISVDADEIVAIIGANGAGKSTLLKTISSVTPPRHGHILLNGRDITRYPPEEIVRIGISQVPEGRQIFNSLSVRDNLALGAYLRQRKEEKEETRQSYDFVYSLFPVLREREKQRAGTLSGGEQQMLAIARALMSKPVMMLLDEPSLGLAPIVTEEILKVISELSQQGVTIVLVEQNVRAALEISDRGYVMELGNVVFEGGREKLLGDEKVKKAYLGKY
jgi:branched-chain amino acid transport system ATP-binding protein